MVLPNDTQQEIRAFRRVGSRKTGKIDPAKIRMVLESLEKEANLPLWKHRRLAKDINPNPKDRSLNGLADREASYMSIGSWRLLLAISLPLYTGYRSVDCVKVLWEDLVYQTADGGYVVHDTFTTREQKTHKRREVPINDELARIIINAFNEIKPRLLGEYVFRSRYHGNKNRNVPVTRQAFWKFLTHAFIRFGVYDRDGKVSAHCLRKSYAHVLFEKLGGDFYALLQLKTMFNHSSVEMTMRYLDIQLEASKNAHDTISFLESKSVGPAKRDFRFTPRS